VIASKAGPDLPYKLRLWVAFSRGRLKEALTKEDLGTPAPGQAMRPHAFFEVAVAGQEFESFSDESLGTLASGMKLDWSRWMRSW
jgi:hypothetical protein